MGGNIGGGRGREGEGGRKGGKGSGEGGEGGEGGRGRGEEACFGLGGEVFEGGDIEGRDERLIYLFLI